MSYSQIVIYSNPCKTVTDGSLLSIRDKLILCRSPKIYNEIFPDQPLSCLKRTGLRLTIRKLGALFIAFEHVVINFKPIIKQKLVPRFTFVSTLQNCALKFFKVFCIRLFTVVTTKLFGCSIFSFISFSVNFAKFF